MVEESDQEVVIKEKSSTIKIAVVGNVDAGKSSLVGVLSKGQLDDGNGFSRKRILNFNHELETGRTSSIAYEIMGFDKAGK